MAKHTDRQGQSAAQLRALYLNYFVQHGHILGKSSPLIPSHDPTLMFTNAGMVPFKDAFSGQSARPAPRMTTCQKCLRVSGKHNDLEEVGMTTRHHTLFEMLGNFSFRDYFKEEAIFLAWQFIHQELQLPKDKLWITVFAGDAGLPADQEAFDLWRKISGLPSYRIVAKGAKDNFWAMGDTGPCGPCTEIYIDQGTGPVKPEDFDNGRVMEIWNNVFMQFDRQTNGTLVPLPAPCVDTGMGLERLAAFMQGQTSNYHSDLFMPIIDATAQLAGIPYQKSDSANDISMRVLADHARATAFLVADGIKPSNEGRGYVMRRIMRRAIRHGRRLGLTPMFLSNACDTVVHVMGDVYPELKTAKALLRKICEQEQETFGRTLDTGLRLLEEQITTQKQAHSALLPGDVVFKLYDTFGFPTDLTQNIAQEAHMQVDMAGFDVAMQAQKTRSKAADAGYEGVAHIYKELFQTLGANDFIGYPHEQVPLHERSGTWRERVFQEQHYLEAQVRVAAIVQAGQIVQEVHHGEAEIVLMPSPLYGESGGQVGDTGVLSTDAELQADIVATQKPISKLIVNKIVLQQGHLRVGDVVWAGYPINLREQIRAHHSATHLLHHALRQVLGEHVQQAGSWLDAHALRFDYSHFAMVDKATLAAIEADVNAQLQQASHVINREMSFDEAKQLGAMALFGEKYADTVRVVQIGDSLELCGGTHVANTAELALVLIGRETAVQSGVRRIEAYAGAAAYAYTHHLARRINQAVACLYNNGATTNNDDWQTDNEASPVLQSIKKVAQEYAQLLEKTGEAALFTPEKHGVKPWVLPTKLDYAQAKAVRDTWQALVQLTNSKLQDVKNVLVGLEHIDQSHILQGTWQLLQDHATLVQRQTQLDNQDLLKLSQSLTQQVQQVGAVQLLTTELANKDIEALRALTDLLRSQLQNAVVCVANVSLGKVTLLLAVSKSLVERYSAVALVKELAPLIAGRGGGKAYLAQAGGTDASGINAAFAKLAQLVKS